MDDKYKEVYFEKYCNKCAHRRKAENEYPCDECLSNGVNVNSHRPTYFTKGGSARNGKKRNAGT